MSVGQSEIFYLFVESQGNPEVDPVLFYIVGGPGCAALNGFFFQTGMLMVSSIYQGFYLGVSSFLFVDIGANVHYNFRSPTV